MEHYFAALIRHGEFEKQESVPSAHLPHPLTAEGEAQAVACAAPILEFARERGLRVDDRLRASPLLRAWQTADRVARELSERLGRPFRIEQVPALAERSLGSLGNLTTQQIETIVARDPRHGELPAGWKRDSGFRLPYLGAESLLEAGQRVARYMNETLGAVDEPAHTSYLTLFFGHGGAFRHAAMSLGVLSWQQVAGLSMHHCRPVFLERRSDGTCVQVGGKWKERATGASSVD